MYRSRPKSESCGLRGDGAETEGPGTAAAGRSGSSCSVASGLASVAPGSSAGGMIKGMSGHTADAHISHPESHEVAPSEAPQSVPILSFLSFFFFLVFLPFLGLHSQHMEVPRLGVYSELKPPACTTAHGNAGSLTPRARPGITPTTSWFLVGLINHRATTGTLSHFLRFSFFWSLFFLIGPHLRHMDVPGLDRG